MPDDPSASVRHADGSSRFRASERSGPTTRVASEKTTSTTTEPAHAGRSAAGQQQAPTVLDQMGGPVGLVYTGLPVVAFVVGNAVFGLLGGIICAVGLAVAISVLRLVRREPIQPAVSGLFGVAVAAFVAYQTGC